MLDVLRVDNIAVDISIVAVEQDVAKAGGAAAIVTTITNNLGMLRCGQTDSPCTDHPI